MDKIGIAKKLLNSHTCRNCKDLIIEGGLCGFDKDGWAKDATKGVTKVFQKGVYLDGTCDDWEKI